MAFILHAQLEADTVFLGDLPLSRVLLMNDARFPWVILVPRVAGASEWFDLGADEQAQLAEEACRVGAAMKAELGSDKINIAALGNQVPQLHVHVIARFTGDAAWPNPVWGCDAPKSPYPTLLESPLAECLRRVMAEHAAT